MNQARDIQDVGVKQADGVGLVSMRPAISSPRASRNASMSDNPGIGGTLTASNPAMAAVAGWCRARVGDDHLGAAAVPAAGGTFDHQHAGVFAMRASGRLKRHRPCRGFRTAAFQLLPAPRQPSVVYLGCKGGSPKPGIAATRSLTAGLLHRARTQG